MPQAYFARTLLEDAAHAARLRFWIVVVGVLVIAAFAGSTAYDAWRSHQHVVSATDRELRNLAQALARQAEDTLQTSDLLLRDTVAWFQNEHPAPGSVADAKLASRAAGLPQVRVATIIDARGRLRIRSRPIVPLMADVSDRAYFIAQRDHPGLGVFLSEPLFTRSEHRFAVVMSRRLEGPNRSFDGVAQAEIDLEAFQRVYEAIDVGSGSAIHLLRDDGTLLVREPQTPPLVGSRFPELVAADSAPAGLLRDSADRVPRFAAVARVADFPLLVAVSREKNIALEGWRTETYRVATRTLALMLLGALAIVALVNQLRRIEQGERALRKSEERYSLAMEGANEGHFDWSFDEDTAFLSPQMQLLHGRSADAVVTTRDAWLASLDVHPDDVLPMETAARDHLEGRTDRYVAEYRVRHPDGQWHWLQARGRCLRDASGTPHRFVGSAIDITARKSAEAEQERLEVQLRQSQKLEAMGTLAGGIAHDFNNILGAILGYGELAQKAAPESSVVRRYLDSVMQAGGRAKALVERILAFSRSGVGERGPVNVQAVVEETLELLAAALAPGVRLVRRLEAGSAAILGDATLLHQVTMNLCTNALQAMPTGGVLEVTLDRAEVAQDQALTHGILGAGVHVRLCISDTGSGIAPHVLERMFDPFYTTKGVGEGTGLGLSLVHGIVADLDGAIDVRTVVGRGTQFTIWLPIVGEASAALAELAPALPRGHGQTVLIVDDEPPLVALAEEMLAELGYEPIGFGSAPEALKAFRAAPQRFDVVLTDEMMPELVGTDLAREIRLLRPEVPVVLMSGYSNAHLHERASVAGVWEVLSKPLQIGDIAACLGRVLR